MHSGTLPFPSPSETIRRAMADSHYRPYSSSCPRCHRLLDLAAVREGDTWYCGAACAQGRPGAGPERSVSASRLTNRPRRFHGRRRPRELRVTARD
jgi:hypothetical protein